MPIAAVPLALAKQINTDITTASPGLRFGYYLNIWNADWSKPKSVPVTTWKSLTALNVSDKAAMQALADRQQAQASRLPENARLTLDASATAPFSTGLGNEHPLENGFAFLNPYGLPYLAGSGVKGVLRQAARELASGDWDTDEEGHVATDVPRWSAKRTIDLHDANHQLTQNSQGQPIQLSVIDALFGRETDSDDTAQVRGALTFWDVIPQIKGDSLSVGIMTPHQGHYYQQNSDRKTGASITPHDSGQPIPIQFLTVPPGSGFSFTVTCDTAHLARLAPELAWNDQWKALLMQAFTHAFTWLGFGAKTAVGYGALQEDPTKKAAREAQQRDQQEKLAKEEAKTKREAELARLSPVERFISEAIDIKTAGQSNSSALMHAMKQAVSSDMAPELRVAVAQRLKQLLIADKGWREKSEKKNPEKDKPYQQTLMVMGWLKP